MASSITPRDAGAAPGRVLWSAVGAACAIVAVAALVAIVAPLEGSDGQRSTASEDLAVIAGFGDPAPDPALDPALATPSTEPVAAGRSSEVPEARPATAEVPVELPPASGMLARPPVGSASIRAVGRSDIPPDALRRLDSKLSAAAARTGGAADAGADANPARAEVGPQLGLKRPLGEDRIIESAPRWALPADGESRLEGRTRD